MATTTNTLRGAGAGYTTLTAENAEIYNRTMLERLTPELFFAKYGEKGMGNPKNNGDTVSYRRLNSLAVSTTELTEGVTPEAVGLDIVKITAQVKQYGNYAIVTDKLDMMALDPIITETSELMGENAGESIDIIVRDIIAAGTNVMYAGGKTARNLVASTDKITALDVLKVRRQLKRNKVKPINLPDGKGKGYIWFIHTDVATDLMQTDEWKRANIDAPGSKNFPEGAIGKMYGIYFMEADNAPKFAGAGASSADIYANLIIGRGAYGVPDIKGSAKPQIIVHPAGSAGTADPLDQRSTIGWKALLTAVRLQELAIVRHECSSTP